MDDVTKKYFNNKIIDISEINDNISEYCNPSIPKDNIIFNNLNKSLPEDNIISNNLNISSINKNNINKLLNDHSWFQN